MVHRVDYHNVLKEVALSEEGVGMPVKLHLQSGVQSCDPEQGIITLRNGETHQGDVVIGADGIRVRKGAIPPTIYSANRLFTVHGSHKCPWERAYSSFLPYRRV